MKNELVIVLDFGGQYNQLVARRVRECNVYCEIYSYKTDIEKIKAMNPKGIILTGGPNSCYEADSPTYTKELFELGIPVLGLCYGAQLMSHVLGGEVKLADVREYGKTEVIIDKPESKVFAGVSTPTICWMSHFDYIAQVASGFEISAHTADCPVAAAENAEKKLYAIQFHPEVLDYYQERFRYIMVDEYQDTNHIQFLLVKMLARKYRNLCVVGDDDQSIYKFRGANITNILNFEKEYEDAKVIKLEQNYRSCGNILAAANAVIQHNAGRKDKALWTDKDAGEKISFEQCDSEYAEGDMVASRIKTLVRQGVDYRDIAILYRTNAQSRVLGEKMVYANIPYRVYGGTNFYARKEIKDVLAYLKVINNSTDNLYFRRVVNVPKRGIGEASLSKVESFADAYGLSMMDAAARADEIPGMAAKTSAKIRQFAELITSFRDMLADGESLDSVYDRILEDTGYESELIAEHTEEAMTRLENIDELRNKVVEFTEDNEEAGLSEFLEEIALVSDLDAMSEDDNQVKLMTLHSAKGLEFPYVFICGMEDRVFPSGMALNSDDPDALEEERRLCYVGITRAMKKLYLSAAKERMMHGNRVYSDVSRFIREIPPMLFEHEADMKNMAKRRESESVDRYNRGEGRRDAYGSSYGDTYAGYGGGRTAGAASGRSYGQKNPYSSYAKQQSYGQPSSQPSFGKAFVVNSVGKPDYAVGDRVRHIKFGPGTVEALEKGDKDYEVTVNFDRCGVRKMFASFAKLKKCE